MQIYGIEGRYAHALYSAAFKKKSLEKVETDVKKMQVEFYDYKAECSYLN